MPISSEIRRLKAKWQTNTGWPKRLDWLEISGIRGWTGQRFDLKFPIMAVVGENGVGKSTLLQCAAAIYRSSVPKQSRFASDFFPDTTWDRISNAVVTYSVREGNNPITSSIRKPGERWRGNPQRREREVEYIDLSRIQPVPARLGYTKLANPGFREVSSNPFETSRLARLSAIMGRTYDLAKMALTNADLRRTVPVIGHQGATYSGFHQGAGETTVAELLQADLPQYGIVLIDEIETSLHPRAQRRLIRDLSEKCRERELQVVLTTHSPYVLEELPPEARAYILQSAGGRSIVYGVSPEFAMTKMDDVPQYECDLYVEDRRAQTMLVEILASSVPDLVQRCRVIPYGASSVGQALGQMVAARRFPRPSCVFLDGDEGSVGGCINLPGDDAPERVVFEALRARNWPRIADRTGRTHSRVADECERAMSLADHHLWIDQAATALVLGGDTLWQALCSVWAKDCLSQEEAARISRAVEDAMIAGPTSGAPQRLDLAPQSAPAAPVNRESLPTEPPAQPSANDEQQPTLFPRR
jgi:predicted ATPase